MTFSITVPNASQSPGLFPTQNNTNFQRLQDIVDAEHNFTNSVSASQGIHKQVTFINRSSPVGLPAGNGILYSKPDSAGGSQLNWFNGSTDYQITPGVLLVSSSQSFTSGTSAVIFADPGYAYMCYYWAAIDNSNSTAGIISGYAVKFAGGNKLIKPTDTSILLSISYSGNDLQIINNSVSTETLDWALQVCRLY